MNKLAFLEGYMEKEANKAEFWQGLIDILTAKQFRKGFNNLYAGPEAKAAGSAAAYGADIPKAKAIEAGAGEALIDVLQGGAKTGAVYGTPLAAAGLYAGS